LHAFLYYQLFTWLTGSTYVNVCCEAEDGKSASDGANHVVTTVARLAVRRNLAIGGGARGLLCHVADARRRPRADATKKRGLFTHSACLHVYAGSKDGGALFDIVAKEGYAGSSLDHVFKPSSGARKAAAKDQWLCTARRPCGCEPCLVDNDWDSCVLARLHPNPSQLVQMLPQLGEAIARMTRNAANAAFAGAIKVGTVLVLRVNSLEANVHGEPFFLAIASAEEGEKVVYKALKTGLEGSNYVKKGQWLVRLRWLHYGKHGRNEDLPGARLYVHKPGEHSLLMPMEGVISNTQVVSAAQKLVRVEGKRPMWLPKEAVDVVLENSNELLS